MGEGWVIGLAIWWVGVWSGVLVLLFRRKLVADWKEAVFRRPVLILESDDWGVGPPEDAEALTRLIEVLSRFHDRDGQTAVMTLGVVLSCPAGNGVQGGYFHRLTLEDKRFSCILAAMRTGMEAGVLSWQLHGMEHFWPPAVLWAADSDASIREWLSRTCADAYELPSYLQSRWTYAATLPSRSIARREMEKAAAEEVALYTRLFGRPEVVVPPTFVWNDTVEAAWVKGGAQVIVTPGQRLTCRDGTGQPACPDKIIRNGDTAIGGASYVVRDVYFEPARGHLAEDALREVGVRFRLGRPALIETHRVNYQQGDMAFNQLERLLTSARKLFPDVAFMSTCHLGRILREGDSAWMVSGVTRVTYWLRRLAAHPKLRRLAWLSGLALPVALWLWVAGRTR